MGKGYRPGRIGEEIRKLISNMLLTEVKDPVIKENWVSISAVDVTNDGSYATCYISVLGTGKEGFATDEKKEEIIAAFNRAKGLFKREIGKQIQLRRVPELIFKIDNAQEYGQHMDNIINNLNL